MANRNIHIENIQVSMPPHLVVQAHEIGNGLGQAILHAIAESTLGKHGHKKIAALEVGKVSVKNYAEPRGIQQQIASHVANTIREKF